MLLEQATSNSFLSCLLRTLLRKKNVSTRVKINLPGKIKHVTVHMFASLNFFCERNNFNCEKVGLRLKLHCGNSNLLPCEPTCSCYSVTCLLGSTRSSAVFLVIYLNFWVKPLLVQCSCPSDMFELLDQAPPIPVQLSKSQQTA